MVVLVCVLLSYITQFMDSRRNRAWLSKAWGGLLLLLVAIDFGVIALDVRGGYVTDWRYGALTRSQFLLPAGGFLALGLWWIYRAPDK
jgi:hypothetical protein